MQIGGITVEELKSRMSTSEFMKWLVYFKEQQTRTKRAENRAKGIIDFTDPEAGSQMAAMFKGR